MKKYIIFVILLANIISSYAQLGEPTITERDTFNVVAIKYNKMELSPKDWPSKYIIEDPIFLDIAEFKYKKTSAENGMILNAEKIIYNVVCNGKSETMFKIIYDTPQILKHGTQYQIAYHIGDYIFYTAPTNNISIGTGFSLAGRTAKALPSPSITTQKEGKIVVKIWVNREGNVIQSSAPEKGSTITDQSLVNQAKSAAIKAKFSTNPDAPESQTGTITYVFQNN